MNQTVEVLVEDNLLGGWLACRLLFCFGKLAACPTIAWIE